MAHPCTGVHGMKKTDVSPTCADLENSLHASSREANASKNTVYRIPSSFALTHILLLEEEAVYSLHMCVCAFAK